MIIVLDAQRGWQNTLSFLRKWGETLVLDIRFNGYIDNGRVVRFTAKIDKNSDVLVFDISGTVNTGRVMLQADITDINLKNALTGKDIIALYSEIEWQQSDTETRKSSDILFSVQQPVRDGGETGPLPADGTVAVDKIITSNEPIIDYVLSYGSDGKGVWVPMGSGGSSSWEALTGVPTDSDAFNTTIAGYATTGALAAKADQVSLDSTNTRVTTLEGVLTDDVQSAISGAHSPSVSNPFATLADTGGGPSGFVWGNGVGTLSDQTDLQTALDVNSAAISAHVGNVTNPHSVTKTQVGLGNVDNTSDTGKPVSTAQQTALDLKAPLASPAFTGTPTGITKTHVGLGNADNTSDVNKPVSTAQQTALDLKANSASPAFTGTVTGITKAMVGLSNVDNTTDVGKPISTAQQTALDLKAPLASPAFTGTPTGITKTHVGLGNVDNTSDANKPVSTAQQTALDLKAPIASPTFTGTVSGVTKAMVGLANVDNTSDANKPVSTAQQTALDLKAPLASPTFTGTVTGITKTHVGLGNIVNNVSDDIAANAAQRTIGTGALQACAGNDSRLSNARTPSTHATSHVTGGSDVIADVVAAGNSGLMTGSDKTKLNAVSNDAAAGTASMRSLSTTSTTACAGNDSRLSDARTPSAHATSHVTGGSDVIANVVAAGNAGLMTGTDKTKLDGIATSANNYVHPNHSGDVTSTGDGATVIGAGKVTKAMQVNAAANSLQGNNTGNAAVPVDLTVAQLKTMLGIVNSLAVIQHQTNSGTAGGAATTGAYTTRPLTTIAIDPDSIASLASNQITLQAGTYEIDCWQNLLSTAAANCRLRNITDSTTIAQGSSGFENTTLSNMITLHLRYRFVLASAKAIALQYYVDTNNGANALGADAGHTDVNIHAMVSIRKVA